MAKTKQRIKDKDIMLLAQIYLFWMRQVDAGRFMPAAPQIRELMPLIGVASTNTVNYRLERLRKLGLVEETNGKRSGARITQKGAQVILKNMSAVLSIQEETYRNKS